MQLVVAKLIEKNPNERQIAVKKILNAIYPPNQSTDARLECLINYVRDTYHDLDENAKQTFAQEIERNSSQWVTNSHRSYDDIEDMPPTGNGANALTIVSTPKWMDTHKKIGKMMRILVGVHYGMIVQVKGFENNRIVLAKLPNGQIRKFLLKHVEFLK